MRLFSTLRLSTVRGLFACQLALPTATRWHLTPQRINGVHDFNECLHALLLPLALLKKAFRQSTFGVS
jgi:hypothetical protein